MRVALLALVAALTLAAAGTALAESDRSTGVDARPPRVGTVKLVPRVPHDPGAPRLANAREVAAALMVPMMLSGTVAEGTVFAGVRIGADGGVARLDESYGGIYDASPEMRRWLGDATSRAKFDFTPDWREAHGGTWAVFWTLQTNGCRPWTFDAPARATVIRICLDVTDGKVRPAFSAYVVDRDVVEQPSAMPVFASRRVPSYAGRGGEQGVRGEAHLRITLDDEGRVARREAIDAALGDAYDYWLDAWQNTARFEVPGGWPGAGRARTFDFRIAFDFAPEAAAECAWVLPMFEGGELRICIEDLESPPWTRRRS